MNPYSNLSDEDEQLITLTQQTLFDARESFQHHEQYVETKACYIQLMSQLTVDQFKSETLGSFFQKNQLKELIQKEFEQSKNLSKVNDATITKKFNVKNQNSGELSPHDIENFQAIAQKACVPYLNEYINIYDEEQRLDKESQEILNTVNLKKQKNEVPFSQPSWQNKNTNQLNQNVNNSNNSDNNYKRNNQNTQTQNTSKSLKLLNSKKEPEEEPQNEGEFVSANDALRKMQNQKNGGNNSNSAPRKTLGGKKRKFVSPMIKDESVEEQVSKKVFRGNNDNNNSKSVAGDNGESSIDNINGVPLDDDRLRNVDPRLLELVQNEILSGNSLVLWDDIAGLSYAKQTIKEIIIWPLQRPDLFTGLRGPPKGLLLFGPPGTGKTLIGKAVAGEAQATFFSISASSLTSKWIGEGEKMVRALFAVASCYQPSVIFVDEIDSLLTSRSENDAEASRRLKTEFLVQLDGAGNTNRSTDRILLIGATNRPQELDDAALRRLSKRLYIPLPNFEGRVQLITNTMKKAPHNLTKDQIDMVAEKSDGYSGADLSSLCSEAAMEAIREVQSIEMVSQGGVRDACYEDFEKALQHVKPSVSNKILGQYEEWNKEYGSDILNK